MHLVVRGLSQELTFESGTTDTTNFLKLELPDGTVITTLITAEAYDRVMDILKSGVAVNPSVPRNRYEENPLTDRRPVSYEEQQQSLHDGIIFGGDWKSEDNPTPPSGDLPGEEATAVKEETPPAVDNVPEDAGLTAKTWNGALFKVPSNPTALVAAYREAEKEQRNKLHHVAATPRVLAQDSAGNPIIPLVSSSGIVDPNILEEDE